MYTDTNLYINGKWMPGTGEGPIDVFNPATGERIGSLASASREDVDLALQAAAEGFRVWRKVTALERSRVLREAAAYVRRNVEEIGRLLTNEQGKPLAEAMTEATASAEVFEWFAEEARRIYGRSIPPRVYGATQLVVREPVGVVAAFTPWNFPLSQTARKVGAALAAGCSLVVKPPEEAPSAVAQFAKAFQEAGLPAGVLNLVYGDPQSISEQLIADPRVRKVSFTGSVPVGKQLAALAGTHMKRVTMELGGHAPAIVFDDADIESAVSLLATAKFRNAGQVCVSPTRFLVQEGVFDTFLKAFVERAKAIVVGPGENPEVQMGPLATDRRLAAVEALVEDAVSKGARVETGGKRIGKTGTFFEPTVLSQVPLDARAMNEEPFGPVALINSFKTREEALQEANRLPYGLAAYAFTKSSETIGFLTHEMEVGMLTINRLGLAMPETPFGGVKDSGYGSEGGTEAIEPYLTTKFVTFAD